MAAPVARGLRALRKERNRFRNMFVDDDPDPTDWYEGTATPEFLQGCAIHIPRDVTPLMEKWKRDGLKPLLVDERKPRAAKPLRPRDGLRPSTRQVHSACSLCC